MGYYVSLLSLLVQGSKGCNDVRCPRIVDPKDFTDVTSLNVIKALLRTVKDIRFYPA